MGWCSASSASNDQAGSARRQSKADAARAAGRAIRHAGPACTRRRHDRYHAGARRRGPGRAADRHQPARRDLRFSLQRTLSGCRTRSFTVLVNPQIEPLGDVQVLGWEGCLSLPGLRGEVPRYERIRYTGMDPEGRSIDRSVEGFHARVVQHECDHLDGVLYPMRMRDFARFGFERKSSARAWHRCRADSARGCRHACDLLPYRRDARCAMRGTRGPRFAAATAAGYSCNLSCNCCFTLSRIESFDSPPPDTRKVSSTRSPRVAIFAECKEMPCAPSSSATSYSR